MELRYPLSKQGPALEHAVREEGAYFNYTVKNNSLIAEMSNYGGN